MILNDGPAKLFEFDNCGHLANGLTTIDEVHSAISVSFAGCVKKQAENAAKWADQVDAHVRRSCGDWRGPLKFGLERMNSGAARSLEEKGFIIEDAQEILEVAKSIKTPEEIKCIRQSLESATKAVANVRWSTRPGLTENELWSQMHSSIIKDGGEYIETRLMTRYSA